MVFRLLRYCSSIPAKTFSCMTGTIRLSFASCSGEFVRGSPVNRSSAHCIGGLIDEICYFIVVTCRGCAKVVSHVLFIYQFIRLDLLRLEVRIGHHHRGNALIIDFINVGGAKGAPIQELDGAPFARAVNEGKSRVRHAAERAVMVVSHAGIYKDILRESKFILGIRG